jgi:putative membrane protein
MSRSLIAAAVIALGVSGGVAFAQTTTPPASADQIQPADVTDPGGFATKAHGAGLFEIQSSQLALTKSQSADIKAFAQKMIDDHSKADDELKTAAQSQGGITLTDQLDAGSQENLQKLQAASGADFDSLYVQLQTQGHIEAVGLFSGYAQSGEAGALKDFATRTLPTLKDHYNMVIKLPK